MIDRVEPPFPRTVCDCALCVANCQRQPGWLMPGDLERILALLGEPTANASKYFWSSEGGVVGNSMTGRQWRVRTITPRYDRRKKACIFLDEQHHCRIHAVSPFGCAYFDRHMSPAEGMKRSAWSLTLIHGNDEYTAQRQALPFADHYKPLGY